MSEQVELTEADIIAAAEMMLEAEKKAAQARQDMLDHLGNTIDSKLSSRMGRRKTKEAQWLESARLYLGSLSSKAYLPTERDPFGDRAERADTRRPEVNIVRVKCDAAISQTISYQFAAGDKNWDINPPAVSDISVEDIAQTMQTTRQPMNADQATAYRAGLMSAEIEYHLTASRYAQEARLAMKDRVILGSGIMKAPTNSSKLKKTYVKTETPDGRPLRVPVFTPEKMPEVYKVNPWYFFPDDTATDIRKCEDAIEIHLMSKTEVKELLQRPDFFRDQLERVLEEEPREYSTSPFTDPAFLTQGGNTFKGKYVVQEYHGPVTKKMLETAGVCGCDDMSYSEQYAEIWVINQKVVKFDLSNLEGCVGVPYCVSVWEPDPGSVFGFGIPMLARDQQRVVNETYKMMLDNAGISAGPQVVVDLTLIQSADGTNNVTPGQTWYSTEYGADVTKAIQFFTPPNSYEGLANLFQLAKQLADEESSIPLLLSGLSTPTGAGDSATGMALMNQNATSPLFYKAEEWDDAITQPIISMMYDWEMQFNPKEEIKGTYEIDVRTSTSYLRNSQDMQKLQALRMELAQGSPMGEWINMDELLQVTLMGMRLPYKAIIKSPEQVAEERANAPEPPPDPALLKAQADMRRVENEERRLELDAQIAQSEAENARMLAEIQAQVQFGTNETRAKEAEAQVIKAQLDYQSAMAAVASKDETARAQIIANMQTQQMNQQVQMFLAGRSEQMQAMKIQTEREKIEAQKEIARAKPRTE